MPLCPAVQCTVAIDVPALPLTLFLARFGDLRNWVSFFHFLVAIASSHFLGCHCLTVIQPVMHSPFPHCQPLVTCKSDIDHLADCLADHLAYHSLPIRRQRECKHLGATLQHLSLLATIHCAPNSNRSTNYAHANLNFGELTDHMPE